MKRLLVKIIDCVFLMRIPLLAPVWTILLLGWITGSSKARPGGSLFSSGTVADCFLLWVTLAGFSLIVAFIYITNQIADIESDRINHKLFLLPQNILSVKTAWVLAVLCAVSGMAVAMIFSSGLMSVLFAFGILLGFLYNFPPARLKDRAWGGTIANFGGHGVVTFLVGWLASQNSVCSWRDFIVAVAASLSAGFANAAVYITTTIPDAEGDAKTGKKTFCVTYGSKATAVTATIFCAFSFAFAFLLQYNQWLMLAPAAICTVLFLCLAISPQKENAFKAFKWPVFILTAGVSVFVPVYALLILATFAVSRIYYKARFNYNYPTFKSR